MKFPVINYANGCVKPLFPAGFLTRQLWKIIVKSAVSESGSAIVRLSISAMLANDNTTILVAEHALQLWPGMLSCY